MPDINQFGHVLGFGRKSTRPTWFDRYDGRKDLFLWEKRICGHPRVMQMESEYGSPFAEAPGGGAGGPVAMGERVPCGNLLTRRGDRAQRERGAASSAGAGPGPQGDSKFARYGRESLRSNMERECIKQDRLRSEVKDTIYGNGRPISTPILYPDILTHADGLVLDKKVMAVPHLDEHGRVRPKPVEPPFKRTSQYMYLPYARTHRDFPRRGSEPESDRHRWMNGGSLSRGGLRTAAGAGDRGAVPRLPLPLRPETARSDTSRASVTSITSLKGILS